MKHLKKINFVVLPLAIWVTMIFYHGIVLKPFSDLMMNISAPFVLSFVLHTIVQLLVISSLTVTAVKKLGYILGEKNQLIADLYREKSELEEANKELDEVIKTQAKQIEELNAKLNPDKHVHSQEQGMYPTL